MKQIRFFVTALLLLLLLPWYPQAKAETAEEAENLTKSCTFDFGSYKDAANTVLRNSKYYLSFRAGSSITVSWEDAFEDARLCVQWQLLPRNVSILQFDAEDKLLCSEILPPYPETVTPLLPEARKAVVQTGESDDMAVLYCAVFGTGTLPDPFYEWLPLPDHIDYLLISTHPDDDVLYLGSVVPTYGAERGLIGTIIYVTASSRVRMKEAEDGAWTMGLRYQPLFFGLRDINPNSSEQKKKQFSYQELLLQTVRAYRSLKPLVVFAQDENGEYGHFQHVLTSKAAREAFTLAADPSYDPESVEQYGTWQVQKVYLHLYRENTILIDAHTPLSFFDGMDAYEVARAAFKKHESQQRFAFSVSRDDQKYAFNRFGMSDGAVEAGEDVFDNIDETFLSDYVPPTPTPEPTPVLTPTPKPTQTPTEASPTPEPSKEPTEEPDPKPSRQNRNLALPVICGAAVLAAAGYLVFCLRKKRDRNTK